MKLVIEFYSVIANTARRDWQPYDEIEVHYEAEIFSKLAGIAYHTDKPLRVTTPTRTIYAKKQADGGIYIGENKAKVQP